MTITPVIDPDGSASRAAATGRFALGVGDTELAAMKFAEAGTLLERRALAARTSADRNLFRFLAASQFFYGGRYSKAVQLTRRIQERLLPASVRRLFAPFHRDASTRAAAGYAAGVRQVLATCYQDGRHAEAIELLKAHPYVLDRVGLAYFRAALCGDLGQYAAAAHAFATAMRFAPDEPSLLLAPTAGPLGLLTRGQVTEAWAYAERLAAVVPQPMTLVVASVACYYRAIGRLAGDARSTREEQFRYFESARGEFQRWPEPLRLLPDLRDMMTLGYLAAIVTLWQMGELAAASAMCDAAIGFEPDSAVLRSLRGMIAVPELDAYADHRLFKETNGQHAIQQYVQRMTSRSAVSIGRTIAEKVRVTVHELQPVGA